MADKIEEILRAFIHYKNAFLMFKQTLQRSRAWLRPSRLLNDPVKLTMTIGSLFLIILIKISWEFYFDADAGFLVQLLAELHGLVFDLFVIGILIVWINNLSARRRVIEISKQQIEDLRSLRSEFVSLTILTCIKILNRYNVFEMDLNGVSIPNAPLNKINLTGSDLNGFESPEGSFIFARLNRCTMNGCVLDKADLFQADLSHVSANGASFHTANLSKALLCNSKFITASFKNCYLNGASFAGSNLLSADFEGAHLLDVDFRDCKELRVEQLLSARIVHNCILDQPLLLQLQAVNNPTASSSTSRQ